jgi:hypothetical protein
MANDVFIDHHDIINILIIFIIMLADDDQQRSRRIVRPSRHQLDTTF